MHAVAAVLWQINVEVIWIESYIITKSVLKLVDKNIENIN